MDNLSDLDSQFQQALELKFPKPVDKFLLEAMREVDALTPGSPSLYIEIDKPEPKQNIILPTWLAF